MANWIVEWRYSSHSRKQGANGNLCDCTKPLWKIFEIMIESLVIVVVSGEYKNEILNGSFYAQETLELFVTVFD